MQDGRFNAISLSKIPELSAASPEVAFRKPLEEVVKAALVSAASRSLNTARAYQTAIGLSLRYLNESRGHLLPEEFEEWRPFAEVYELERHAKLWRFKGAAVVLRLIDGSFLAGFRAWRESAGDSPNTVAQRIPAVRTFLSVAYREGILTHEQAQSLGISIYRMRLKRDQKPVGRRLTADEVQRLQAACEISAKKGKRDRAILDTLLYLGLRRDEAATLSPTSFRQDKGYWWVFLTGKGKRTRRIKLHASLKESLDVWLKECGRTLGSDSGWIFTSVDRYGNITEKRIDGSLVGKLVTEYGAKAGLAPRKGKNILTPHDLRRTCARNAFDNGASLLLVQSMLGHRDPKTTAIYIGAHEDDHSTAVDFLRY